MRGPTKLPSDQIHQCNWLDWAPKLVDAAFGSALFSTCLHTNHRSQGNHFGLFRGKMMINHWIWVPDFQTDLFFNQGECLSMCLASGPALCLWECRNGAGLVAAVWDFSTCKPNLADLCAGSWNMSENEWKWKFPKMGVHPNHPCQWELPLQTIQLFGYLHLWKPHQLSFPAVRSSRLSCSSQTSKQILDLRCLKEDLQTPRVSLKIEQHL